MVLFDVLSSKLDNRKNGHDCFYNGYLEDYLETIEDSEIKTIFNNVYEDNVDMKIIVNLRTYASKESISNSIIRYKDIFKLGNKAIVIPYILYNKTFGIILDDEYIYAKGAYYAISETGSEYSSYKNEFIALEIKDEIKEAIKKSRDQKLSQIQRDYDSKHFKNYEEGYNRAIELSNILNSDIEEIKKAKKQKDKLINGHVSKWFLLKKFVYVSYMTDKNILLKSHKGNIKAQRAEAKNHSDEIRFVAMSQMWGAKAK